MSFEKKRQLPRLSRGAYRGEVYVFWTHTLEAWGTGWLDDAFHMRFRELLCHVCARHWLSCALYCLMPDHMHLLWIGASERSDQLVATRLLRLELALLLKPYRLQRQPHDHVLRRDERDGFANVCSYIRQNPVRKGLVDESMDWPYLGQLIPGYPSLATGRAEEWSVFWKCHEGLRCRSRM